MSGKTKTISVPEAGRILGVGRGVSFRLAKEGVLPVLRLGKKLRVPISAIEKMLEGAGTERNQEAEK